MSYNTDNQKMEGELLVRSGGHSTEPLTRNIMGELQDLYTSLIDIETTQRNTIDYFAGVETKLDASRRTDAPPLPPMPNSIDHLMELNRGVVERICKSAVIIRQRVGG